MSISGDPFTFANRSLVKNRTVLPPELTIPEAEELGKGSNNRVVEASWKGEPCAFRLPRRKSDTQQKGSAKWEFAQTLRASQLGLSPDIYAAWYAKHGARGFPSGLYMVTEVFDCDMEASPTFLEHSFNCFSICITPCDVVLGLLKHTTVFLILWNDYSVVDLAEIKIRHCLTNRTLYAYVTSCSYNDPAHFKPSLY